MSAAKTLRQCLAKRCCPSGGTFFDANISGNECKITRGIYGNKDVTYPGHTSYGPVGPWNTKNT